MISIRPPQINDINTMQGLFINTLPVAVNFSPEETIKHFLTRLNHQAIERQQFGYLPLSQIQQHNLFDSLLVLENYPLEQQDFITLEQIHIDEQSHYGLTLQILPSDHYTLQLKYKTAQYSHQLATQILSHLADILTIMANQPDSSINALKPFNRDKAQIEGVIFAHQPLNHNLSDDLSSQQRPAFIAPQTPEQQQLAKIWQQLLDQQTIGLDDNFFALGASSLTLSLLSFEIEKQFNASPSIKALYQATTLRQQAALIRAMISPIISPIISPMISAMNAPAPITIVARQGQHLALSYGQQRLWFIDQLEGHSPLYNMPAALKLTGQLNITALQAALDTIIERHEILRTVYGNNDTGQAMQIIRPPQSLNIKHHDLSQLDESQQQLQLNQLIDQHSRQTFDLTADLMLRISLVKLNQTPASTAV